MTAKQNEQRHADAAVVVALIAGFGAAVIASRFVGGVIAVAIGAAVSAIVWRGMRPA